MRTTRGVKLSNITFPLQVDHGHLTSDQRIDDRGSRIDTLNVEVEVQYRSSVAIGARSLAGTFNYGPIYNLLCDSALVTVTGPLEGVLDNAMSVIERTIADQKLDLIWVQVSASRLGLDVGYPHLCLAKGGQVNARPSAYCRHAGIEKTPLVMSIDHSWCQGDERIEHRPVRTESVDVSFGAWTYSKPIADNDLSGLYNYATLIHHIRDLQGMTINGPAEMIVDATQEMVRKDAVAAGVDLASTHVELKRTGYARCTPILYSIYEYNKD